MIKCQNMHEFIQELFRNKRTSCVSNLNCSTIDTDLGDGC